MNGRRLFLHLLGSIGVPAILWSPVYAAAKMGDTNAIPDTTLIDGTVLRAEYFRTKTTLVVIWATWCPTCLASLPNFERLYQTYRNKGLEILALSLDKERSEVTDFLGAHAYSFPFAMRAMAHREAFGRVIGTPTLMLIDRNGKLVWKHLGEAGAELETALEAALDS